MAEIKRPERVFQLGSMTLEDPDPEAAPEEALSHYQASYPALAHCTLATPREEGGRLVYEVQRPPATTKGRDASEGDPLEHEIAAWEAAQADRARTAADSEVVCQTVSLLSRALRRTDPVSVDLDPRSIPMC